ncbi:molybdopterin-dependent oxidoreductase [Pelotomaculum terephthalicicum JT]|uniref:molybdopterin-dependent oxidoreductase n=1 Tax=Pelotomaculum terephthalicicum TaxID=206393 RepID=UPI001F034762|nr:molybdopterin-dependent oxidoreductase [Pelotomaculum terephthalicicum]MCG9967281.1 molybdopterin-dependent oxidoreductase [Pelotomaculum terephthalicicum JT]
MVETSVDTSKSAKSKKRLVLGIIFLLLVIAVFSFLNHDKTGLKEGKLVIKAGDTILGSFTIADLRKLSAVEKKMTIHSAQGNTDNYFTCTPLLAVLNSIDPALAQNYKRIVVKGIDGYTSGLDMSEVLQPDNVYVVYADYGKPLKTKAGEDGSLRIIICNDEFGQRSVKWLVSMELQ